MAKNKTIETRASVPGYINTISDEKKRKDFSEIIGLIKKQTGLKQRSYSGYFF